MNTLTLPTDRQLVNDFAGYELPDTITWNDIMPVWAKVSETRHYLFLCSISIERNGVYLQTPYHRAEWYGSERHGSVLNALYAAIVTFIKWFNHQKENEQ